MVLVTLRWASVMVVMYLFKREQIAADWQAIRPRLGYLLLLGTLGFTVFSVALYYALIYTTAINTSILQGGMPLFVFAASRSEEHTSELQSLIRNSYAVFCLKHKTKQYT